MPDDQFRSREPGLQSPAYRIEAITPSDSANLARVTRALNVAGSGTLRVMTPDGSVGNVHVGAGIAFPIRVIRVFATGTTATGISGLS